MTSVRHLRLRIRGPGPGIPAEEAMATPRFGPARFVKTAETDGSFGITGREKKFQPGSKVRVTVSSWTDFTSTRRFSASNWKIWLRSGETADCFASMFPLAP